MAALAWKGVAGSFTGTNLVEQRPGDAGDAVAAEIYFAEGVNVQTGAGAASFAFAPSGVGASTYAAPGSASFSFTVTGVGSTGGSTVTGAGSASFAFAANGTGANATPPAPDIFATGGDSAEYERAVNQQRQAAQAYEAEREARAAQLRATLEAAAGLREAVEPETAAEALEDIAEAVEPQTAAEIIADLREAATNAAAIARLEDIAARFAVIHARMAEDDDEDALMLMGV